MQDIDFDELDKAVSSVMDGPVSSEPATTPVPERPTPTVAAQSPATRRSTGRFMDVVHPSSDMRTAPVSRPVSVPSRPTIEEAAPAPTPPVVAEEEVASDVLDSPFLTDAKVEKRPLGAFSDSLNDRFPTEQTQELLPAEVESDEPAIEEPSEEVHVEEPITLADNDQETPKDDLPAEVVVDSPEPKPEMPVLQEVTVAEPSTPLVAASIPQQYKEQPVITDQPSGAIFDTETYHQPLAHPHKKSSGWWVVLWIIGLIIIGGGIGVALYYFVLPQL